MGYPKIVVKPPGQKARAVVERDHAVISPRFGRAYPLIIKSGQGCARALEIFGVLTEVEKKL